MKRNDWTFEYEASAVAKAAQKRAQYHEGRKDFWEEERATAKKAIESKGIEVRDYEVTGGQRHEVVIDPALAGRLSEAQEKVKRHQREAEEYRNWAAVLGADGTKQHLELDHQDVLHFGLA